MNLVIYGTLFTACAYSLTQLGEVTYNRTTTGQSIAEGMIFDYPYLLSQLISYQHWSQPSEWAIQASLGSLIALNLANLSNFRALEKLVTTIWSMVLGFGWLFSFVVGLAGLCVLILGLLHDHYQPSMAILYALWFGLLQLLPRFAQKVESNSKALFH